MKIWDLKDFSLVEYGAECTDVCKEIQAQIFSGNCEIIDLTDRSFKHNVKLPQVFQNSGSGNVFTQNYIGLLEYQGNMIRIGSRFDNEKEQYFFRYLLETCCYKEMKIFKKMCIRNSWGSAYEELLILRFIEQLNQALKKGMFCKYQYVSYNNAKVQGQLDIARHIRENGNLNNGRIAYRMREYTLDHIYNRLFLRAYCFAKKRYPRLINTQISAYPELKKNLWYIKTEVMDQEKGSVQELLNQTQKKIVHTVYREYEPLRVSARAVLRKMGIDIQIADKTVCGFLLDMNQMWEVFVEKMLQEKSGQSYWRSQIEKNILDGHRRVRPDLYNKKEAFVLDCKYKSCWEKTAIINPSIWKREQGKRSRNEKELELTKRDEDEIRKDVFQILAYMLSFNCQRGGIVFPVSKKRLANTHHNLDEIRNQTLSVYTEDANPEKERGFVRIPIGIPDKQKSYEDFKKKMEEEKERVLQRMYGTN